MIARSVLGGSLPSSRVTGVHFFAQGGPRARGPGARLAGREGDEGRAVGGRIPAKSGAGRCLTWMDRRQTGIARKVTNIEEFRHFCHFLGFLWASLGSHDRRARSLPGPDSAKVTKVTIRARKQAYLQAGIRVLRLPGPSLLEVGALLSLSDTFCRDSVTFTTLGTTFGLPGPILGFPAGITGPDSDTGPG